MGECHRAPASLATSALRPLTATLVADHDSDPGILLGGKDYDSGALRQIVSDRGYQPKIPTKSACVSSALLAS